MIRLVQIACIAITAGILWAIMSGVDLVRYVVGDTFDAGFVVGMAYLAAVYLLICWLDPSSRPRGSAADKQSTDNRVH